MVPVCSPRRRLAVTQISWNDALSKFGTGASPLLMTAFFRANGRRIWQPNEEDGRAATLTNRLAVPLVGPPHFPLIRVNTGHCGRGPECRSRRLCLAGAPRFERGSAEICASFTHRGTLI